MPGPPRRYPPQKKLFRRGSPCMLQTFNTASTSLPRAEKRPSAPEAEVAEAEKLHYVPARDHSTHRTLRGFTASVRRWSSGRIRPCHGRDPGSIPGRRSLALQASLIFFGSQRGKRNVCYWSMKIDHAFKFTLNWRTYKAQISVIV